MGADALVEVIYAHALHFCAADAPLYPLSGLDPPTPARKEEDELLLGFLCNPTSTHTM